MWRSLAVAFALVVPFSGQAQDVTSQLEKVQTERLRPLDFAPFAVALDSFQPPPDFDQSVQAADIAALQAAFAAGQLTSEDLTLWHLSRIRKLDDSLRGMLEINPAALDEARAADARRAAGQSLGPLDGIPVSLKDNIGTAAPMHTTANAEILLDNSAAEDAALVTSLRAAGAVIIGKASLSEFAGSLATGFPSGGNGAVGGQGVNPLGPYPTYGSSSGSAISVAAHYAVVSIGTETAGSLIAPASVMSLVGMKPSAGLVSGEGVVPLISSNDGPGPIARSVRDAAVLLGAADTVDVDYTAGLSATSLNGVKVGVFVGDMAYEGGLSTVMTRLGATLALLGADISPATLDARPELMGGFLVYLSAGMRFDMMPYVTAVNPNVVTLEDLITYNAADPKRRIPFGQDLLTQYAPYSQTLTEAEFRALTAELIAVMTKTLDTAFASSGGAEVLVGVANSESVFYATAGYPAITVPIGRKDDGLPVGITLIGKKGQDAQLLSYAYAIEQATLARIAADLP